MIGEVGRCQVTKDFVPMIRSLNVEHWYDMETPPFTPSHWPRNPWTLNLEFKVYYWDILFSYNSHFYSPPYHTLESWLSSFHQSSLLLSYWHTVQQIRAALPKIDLEGGWPKFL